MTDDICPADWMAQEDSIRERLDESGQLWRKVYFGGGTHFQSWLEQFKEVYGEDNIETEEVDTAGGPVCFGSNGEKAVRIWARMNR